MSKKIPIQKIDGLFNQYLDDQTVTAAEYNGNITALKKAIEHNGAILNDVKIIADGKTPEGYITTEHLEDGAVTLPKVAPEVFTGLPYIKPDAFGDFVQQMHRYYPNVRGAFMNGSVQAISQTAIAPITLTGPYITRNAGTVTHKAHQGYQTTDIAALGPIGPNGEPNPLSLADVKVSNDMYEFSFSWKIQYNLNTAVNIVPNKTSVQFKIKQRCDDGFISTWGYKNVVSKSIKSIEFFDSAGAKLNVNPGIFRTKITNVTSAAGYFTGEQIISLTKLGDSSDTLTGVKSIAITYEATSIGLAENIKNDKGRNTFESWSPEIVTDLQILSKLSTTESNNTCVLEMPLQPDLLKYGFYKYRLGLLITDTENFSINDATIQIFAKDSRPGFKTKPAYITTKLSNHSISLVSNARYYCTVDFEIPVFLKYVQNTLQPDTVYTEPLYLEDALTELSKLASDIEAGTVSEVQIVGYELPENMLIKFSVATPEYTVASASLVCLESLN